jgi:hypothetical protein
VNSPAPLFSFILLYSWNSFNSSHPSEVFNETKVQSPQLGSVAYICNPIYSGGRDRRIPISRQTSTKLVKDLTSKKININ